MINPESITLNVEGDGGRILIQMIDDKDATIDMLREQIRAMNSEIIHLKKKLKNLEEKND